MNILHITPYYAPAYPFGGVVRAVEGMARALSARGHTLTVLTTDTLSPTARYAGAIDETLDGVRVVRVRNLVARGTLNLSTPRGMRRAAQPLIESADVVHCHEFRTAENLIVTPVAARAGKPLVLSPHGTLPQDTGRSVVKSVWDRLLSPAVARRFDHVVALTLQEADETRAFWKRVGAAVPPISVIPNGINPREFSDLHGREAFRAQYGLSDAVVVLFMGRLHPRKGAHLLAQAFQQANLPNTRLVIAGPDEGGLVLVAPYVDDRVVMTGYLAGEARYAALAAADVFVLPALGGEGLSVAVLEAMGVGLPVIVSTGCNLPDMSEAGAGVEVSTDVESIANALRLIVTDSARRAQMGEAARQLVHERFTWDSVAERLEAVYRP